MPDKTSNTLNIDQAKNKLPKLNYALAFQLDWNGGHNVNLLVTPDMALIPQLNVKKNCGSKKLPAWDSLISLLAAKIKTAPQERRLL